MGEKLGRIVYVTGGARSGKSSYAEEIVFNTEKKRVYIATSIIFDAETQSRVDKHKVQRGEEWTTIESYKNLPEKLQEISDSESVILLDCLTNMVSNMMIMEENIDWDTVTQDKVQEIENVIKKEVENFIQFIKRSNHELVVVSNEIGMGIVPPYALGRYFRDICGRMNQLVAKEADEAYLLVSGISVKLK